MSRGGVLLGCRWVETQFCLVTSVESAASRQRLIPDLCLEQPGVGFEISFHTARDLPWFRHNRVHLFDARQRLKSLCSPHAYRIQSQKDIGMCAEEFEIRNKKELNLCRSG